MVFNMMDNEKETKLDTEWIKLIKEALDLGLSPNQIREFLKNSTPRYG